MPTVGVLALQGAFAEHAATLQRLGVSVREVRLPSDLEQIDALIIPGGESTTIGKLLGIYELEEPIRQRAAVGMPILGTCAGAIVLAGTILGSDQPRLGLIDAEIRRNAFGRQVESFETELSMPAVSDQPVPGVFIRAPLIEAVGPNVQVLARLDDGRIVAARSGNIVITSFHPELTESTALHAYLLSLLQDPVSGSDASTP